MMYFRKNTILHVKEQKYLENLSNKNNGAVLLCSFFFLRLAPCPGVGHVMADAMYVLLLCLMSWERKSSTATQIRVHNFVLFV